MMLARTAPLTLAAPMLMALMAASGPATLAAQPGTPPMPAGRVELEPLRTGARDFDFLYGTWRVSVPGAFQRLQTKWIMDGRLIVRPIARGGVVAAYEVLRADSATMSGRELMLYDSTSRQWAIRDARSSSAQLELPAYGHFDGPDGLFYGERDVGGRHLPVRIAWHMRGLDKVTWEWAYSLDGGASWTEYWRLDLTRSGPAPGEPERPATNDTRAVVAPSSARRIHSCCYLMEAFRYVVPPGKEKALTQLFNDEAALLSDTGYVHDIALLRDIDRPGAYVWLRGFTSDEAARGFYFAPVWSAHREVLERNAIRIDSAYSLHADVYTSGLTLGERLTPQTADKSAGLVVATIYTFDRSRYGDVLPMSSMVPAMAAAGGRPLALFNDHSWAVDAPAANGDRTPGIHGRGTRSKLDVLFTWSSDTAAYDRFRAALERDSWYRDAIVPSIERNLAAPVAVWRLVPLPGSRAFRWSWERE